MRTFVLLTVALVWSRILGGEWDSRYVDKRCWENTSVTDPVIPGDSVQLFCDPCGIQEIGIQWMKEHGTWVDSNLRELDFKFHNHEYTVGKFILNWDMSLTIHDVQPGDAGRYRCSKDNHVYSWHQVILRNPSEFHVMDNRKGFTPLLKRLWVETRWSDWGPCSQCNKPGTRERIGFCYSTGRSPLEQYHNGIPCNFPFKNHLIWKTLSIVGIDLRDEKIIQRCRISCREADKEARHKMVKPLHFPFTCALEFLKKFRKFVVVYEGDTLRMKCHPCNELYGGVKWHRIKSRRLDLSVEFSWHDNDDENKYALNHDMSMEIRRAERSDEDRYICMKKEEPYSIHKVVVVQRPSKMHVVDLTKNQKPYGKRDMVYTLWMEWGPCSKCGEPGTRIRIGHCFSKSPRVTGELVLKYQSGVPCHFETGERFNWKTIKSPMLDEKMIDTCNQPCIQNPIDIFSSSVQRYAAARRPGQRNPWARPRGESSKDRAKLKVFGYIGGDVNLVCPGASEYAVTEWKNGSRMLTSEQPESGTNATRGRVHIDDLEGSLLIANITAWDEQLYRCYSNGVQTATVRLIVMRPLVDVQAFMGSFLQTSRVLQFYCVVFVLVLMLKCIARCIQNRRYKRSMRAG
ncbi:uncharacterized protein LOC110985721 isoform X2 [Acanthaster planci]|uniref:Uncharacterized protein LOC110985721 isoform X2 n=1 Tax=Acanthaster planci TaxID=133434 RepID=A0A8B7ZCR3_ACAPL|nr:uncharacterized protein LOC110985721 isoform X2 [Acanthaster planci]